MITIQIKGGTIYEIDNDGCFLRYNEHKWEHPHDTWKCTGCAEILPFNHLRFYSFDDFKSMIKSGDIKKFKNGKPRFLIRDLDHGTKRIQGQGIICAHIE